MNHHRPASPTAALCEQVSAASAAQYGVCSTPTPALAEPAVIAFIVALILVAIIVFIGGMFEDKAHRQAWARGLDS